MSPSLDELDMIALPAAYRRGVASTKRADEKCQKDPQQEMRGSLARVIFSLPRICDRVRHALPGVTRVQPRLCSDQLG